MIFFVGILTALLIINCLVLVLLILIQLPKKDAGAGMAFGGAAADALFGAGSGNVLTKITKYATIIFFLMTMFLGYLQSGLYHKPATEFERQVGQQQAQMPVTEPPQTGTLAPAAIPASSNQLLPLPLSTTPAPAAPSNSTATPQK